MNSINFASRNYRAVAWITQALVAGSIVLALGSAGMAWKAVSLRKDISSMQQKLKEAEASDEQLKRVLVEREQIVKDLNAMSGLMDARKFSWTRFLTSIEEAVPLGVALKKVEFDPKERTLSIDGMAQSPESLRNLVVGFERSPSFTDPFLKHQSLDKGIISFNVVAVYHEHKSNDIVQGTR